MTQSVKHLFSQVWGLPFKPQNSSKQPGMVACVYNSSAGKVETGRCLWPMDNHSKLTDDHQANERPCLKEVDGAPLRMISQVVLWYPHECTHMYIHNEAHVYLHTKVCTHAYMSTKALIGLGSCNLNFMFNFEVI